ncbi:hypothetical protein AMJ40_05165 [candidate division TA06 bacterium DG_26]|uniref:PorV/PorQ family protein n=1 Tax=candidate division TA06 bacterium DG_26 TaxID=1703771 RepID=A0A0S7WHK3_UNCT6|nr:MAG: hypothetical protein AMJ40_05165 [candidate division TA06 bacterium DG_26]
MRALVPIIVAFSILFTGFPSQVEARLGGSGGAFLSMGGGARPLALSGAYVAFAEGIDAIYWNPAGIARVDKSSLVFSHALLYADMSHENFAFVQPLTDGAFGISALALISGDIEITDYENQEGTGEFYSANDYAVGFSYARMMTKKFTAGFTMKVINQNIAKVSATGVAFDLGATYNTEFHNLRFGFAAQNFGVDMSYGGEDLEIKVGIGGDSLNVEEDILATYKSEPYTLPLTFQLGAAVDLYNSAQHRFTVEGDLVHPNDQEETYAVGAEYSYREMLFLRAGHTQKNSRGFSGGVGLKVMNFQVDFSFEQHSELTDIKRISLGFNY